MNINVITLEDGLEYYIINTIEYNNIDYLILSNKKDSLNITVRKIKIKGTKEYLVKLDSNEEFNKVMIEFNNKYEKGEK